MALPPEILQETLLNLSVKEILRKCRVSRQYNDFCQDDQFWKRYARERMGLKGKAVRTWKELVLIRTRMSEYTPILDIGEAVYRRKISNEIANSNPQRYILPANIFTVENMESLFGKDTWSSTEGGYIMDLAHGNTVLTIKASGGVDGYASLHVASKHVAREIEQFVNLCLRMLMFIDSKLDLSSYEVRMSALEREYPPYIEKKKQTMDEAEKRKAFLRSFRAPSS